uniref:Bm10210 n=1 Tax=Brugia malayi TaxID=6279 RepID=A0A1I9G7L6_BRUMA|nr:Bm10210 [Brugia malayi]
MQMKVDEQGAVAVVVEQVVVVVVGADADADVDVVAASDHVVTHVPLVPQLQLVAKRVVNSVISRVADVVVDERRKLR